MAKLDDLTKGAPAPARADNPIDPAVIAERLSKLTFAHTRLTLRATSRISLPHNPGATLLGGNGITYDYPIGRHLLNLETVSTYEGTHDIHTLVLGQEVTGLAAYDTTA